jgi:hypothetical protein
MRGRGMSKSNAPFGPRKEHRRIPGCSVRLTGCHCLPASNGGRPGTMPAAWTPAFAEATRTETRTHLSKFVPRRALGFRANGDFVRSDRPQECSVRGGHSPERARKLP